MKTRIIIILLAVLTVSANAQKVTFFSPEFEWGVKQHLGLEENDEVLQSQTDTITSIDLSGLGITDLRDVVYLPMVKVLDLSRNGISNTFPLTVLDSLQLLDLSGNGLESINPLVFCNADKMIVMVANNYISDFSLLFSPTHCQFTLMGTGLQQNKDALYMDLYHLYCDVNSWGQTVVVYRGYTNAEGAAIIGCNGKHATAQLDGASHTMTVPGWPSVPSMVTLNVGELGDTTWVLPPVSQRIAAGANVDIATGLPEGYRIGMANALYGTVTVDGTNLAYTAPADLNMDTVYISYYEGWNLRGFTEYRMINAALVMSGDVDGNGKVNIDDVTALIDYLLRGNASGVNVGNADCYVDGKVNIDDLTTLINYLLMGTW
jgi:Leucine-rich repeat (LRR) protein